MRNLFFSLFAIICTTMAFSQSEEMIATEQAKQDLKEIRTTFEKVHYNPYFNVTKDQINEVESALVSKWTNDSISLKQFMASGMKTTALMSGGHSYLYWKNPRIIPEVKSHFYLPFTGKCTSDGKGLVVTNSVDSTISKGTIVTKVNDVDVYVLFEECKTYMAGIDSYKNAYCEQVFPLFLFFSDLIEPPYSISVENGKELITTEGITITELGVLLNPKEIPDLYSFEILDEQIGLISYNSCQNLKEFKRFLKATFQELKQKNIDKLIIDISKNGGGNSVLNDELLKYITHTPYRQSFGRYWKVSELSKRAYSENPIYRKFLGKDFFNEYLTIENQEIIKDMDSSLIEPKGPKNFFNGSTCFIIGPETFSSANFLADAIKTFQLSTLIGQPTGEYTNDFGEQIRFELKNTGCSVFISSTYDIGANGNPEQLTPVQPDIMVSSDVIEFAKKWLLEKTD